MRRREGVVPGWVAKSVIVAAAGTMAAALPLGASAVSAAGADKESASSLLHKACSATLAAAAFRAHGQVTTGGKSMTIDVYWGSNGALITLTQNGNQTLKAIISGSSTFFEGNKAWWRSVTGSSGSATVLADRWIDMTSDKKDAAGLTQSVNKSQLLQQCGQGWSTSYVGSGFVHGVRATKVHQDSSKESNTYYIDSRQTPYLLRVSGNPSSKNSGDLVFGSYNVQPNTAPPAGAIPISQFQQ